jgi:hypothetical protein
VVVSIQKTAEDYGKMEYSSTSPYYLTSTVNEQYLDVMINRPIESDPTDVYWAITPTYDLRPDLLANDLYDDSGLWWVFAQRNPNTIKDPLFDFVTGVSIYIPTHDRIKTSLGM